MLKIIASVGLAWLVLLGAAEAAKVTVDLGTAQGITLVGAINRWDQDGNPRRPVDPKAKVDAPYVDAKATHAGRGQWVFANLAPGKYDLVILAEGRRRIEGFQFVPVLEFDPIIGAESAVDDETRQQIADDIGKSRHYENRVEPLLMAGDKKAVRVLMMLLRDQPTSYTPGAGTLRHEIWQYTFNYGAWQKEKRTRVLDRVLAQVSELRQWTWLWDPRLGGIEVKNSPVTIRYEMPGQSGPRKLKGFYPY